MIEPSPAPGIRAARGSRLGRFPQVDVRRRPRSSSTRPGRGPWIPMCATRYADRHRIALWSLAALIHTGSAADAQPVLRPGRRPADFGVCRAAAGAKRW